MVDKTKMADELTDAFIRFQYRQENPMPSANDTEEKMIAVYQTNQLFHNKVKCMVGGVMEIICKHLD